MAEISEFQFSNPEMIEFSFKKNESFELGKKMPGNLKLEFKLESFDEDMNEADGRLRLWNGTENDFSELNIPYAVDITFGSHFSWKDSLENPREMISVNGQAMLMSYMRPVLTSLLAFAKGPKMKIPFINFTADTEEQ